MYIVLLLLALTTRAVVTKQRCNCRDVHDREVVGVLSAAWLACPLSGLPSVCLLLAVDLLNNLHLLSELVKNNSNTRYFRVYLVHN